MHQGFKLYFVWWERERRTRLIVFLAVVDEKWKDPIRNVPHDHVVCLIFLINMRI